MNVRQPSGPYAPTFVATGALALLVLAGCLAAQNQPSADVGEASGIAGEPVSGLPEVARMMLIGDQGTGGDEQYAVAKAMFDICRVRGCDAVLAAGDNIYESGPSDVNDPQFDEKFELPYEAFDIPFYLALGNHDNGARGTGADSRVGDVEVAYHFRSDRASDKWHMPARYYDVTIGPLTVLVLDTNTMVMAGDPIFQQDVLITRQTEWFRSALADASGRWTTTLGHHPYISNGAHGNAGAYDQTPGNGEILKRFFDEEVCTKVDFSMAGHDHDLQWLEAASSCPGTEHLVSGAAGKTRSLADENRNAARFQQGDSFGFVWIEVTLDSLLATFYDVDGEVLFEHAATKPPV